MEFTKVVQERFSCRKFTDRPLEEEKLTAILEAGRLAPTAKNLQEQRVYVVRSAEALAKLDTATPCRYGAPVVAVVAFDKNNVFTYPGGKRDSGVEDATIVATHMILAAANEGVDSWRRRWASRRTKKCSWSWTWATAPRGPRRRPDTAYASRSPKRSAISETKK